MSKPNALQQKQYIQWIRLAVFVGFIALFVLVLTKVQNMLLSFVLAFVINFLLGPIVNYLERAGVNRLLSTVAVFALGGVLVTIGVTSIIPTLSDQLSLLQAQVPSYIDATTKLLLDLEQEFEVLLGFSYQADFSTQAETLMLSWTKSTVEDLPAFISKLGATLVLAPFFAFFIIKDGRTFSKGFLFLVPNNLFELTLNMYYKINMQMGQFVRARLLEALIVGLVVWVGLAIIGFPYSSLIALFAGLTNLIPYVGPIIGAIPAIIISLVTSGSGFDLFLVILVFGIAQLIDIVFIIPLVVAKLVDLHPITVVVAIIIGAQLMGVLGMIISIPVASALKVVFINVYRHLVDFRA